ncbi:MAG: hypothetical protein ACYC6J_08600 [Coriobacteriia bacterium]
MNALDQIIADALAGSPETHVAMLAREVVRLRGAWVVVVPELTEDALDIACGAALDPMYGPDAIIYGMRLARREGYKKAWSDLRSILDALRANQGGAT